MEPETNPAAAFTAEPAFAASSQAIPSNVVGVADRPTQGWADRAVLGFVLLGIAARALRYAQELPLWSDECFLAVNFIKRGYLELLKPLDNGQVCPILFLWAERTAVKALGFSEYSLRLFPLICASVSVVVFAKLARRFASGPALVAAVGVFAVGVHPIRHAAEAKPYASDVLAALAILAPAAGWLVERDGPRRLWLLALLIPIATGLSNPAVLAAGGVLLALAGPVWRDGKREERAAFVGCIAALAGSYLVFHVVLGVLQSAAALDGLRRYWAAGFPPLDRPLDLPAWLLDASTGNAFAFPGGGANGKSLATTVCCLIGAIALLRGGRRAALACLAAPLALHLIAAAAKHYPFGPEARLTQYAAPGICILAGLGVGAILDCVRRPRIRSRLVAVGVVGLLGCAIVPQVESWRRPFRMIHDQEAREFARAFWPEVGRDAVVACSYLDFGVGRSRGAWQARRSWYLCNQAASSPFDREFGSPRLDQISEARPLRCVTFDEDPSGSALTAWLSRMRSDFQIRSVRSIPVRSTYGDGQRSVVETWRVYEFTPNPTRIARPAPLPGVIAG